jgi:hypothetical protein
MGVQYKLLKSIILVEEDGRLCGVLFAAGVVVSLIVGLVLVDVSLLYWDGRIKSSRGFAREHPLERLLRHETLPLGIDEVP